MFKATHKHKGDNSYIWSAERVQNQSRAPYRVKAALSRAPRRELGLEGNPKMAPSLTLALWSCPLRKTALSIPCETHMDTAFDRPGWHSETECLHTHDSVTLPFSSSLYSASLRLSDSFLAFSALQFCSQMLHQQPSVRAVLVHSSPDAINIVTRSPSSPLGLGSSDVNQFRQPAHEDYQIPHSMV